VHITSDPREMQAPLLDRDSLLRRYASATHRGLLAGTPHCADNHAAAALHRYGDSTAIPEHLDSTAAPLLHPDDPAHNHAAAAGEPLPSLHRQCARLWAAVALFVGVTALYTAFVCLIRWRCSLPWPWDPARDVPAAASLQTVTVAAALVAEALLQSAWPWTCRPLLARSRRCGTTFAAFSTRALVCNA